MGKQKMPDYTAAAQQQGQANKDAAISSSLLSNPNIVNPYGTQTYSGPVDGSGRPTLTQSLSPAEQAKLDASNRVQLGSLGILEKDMPNIANALSGPFGISQGVQLDPGIKGQIQGGLDYGGAPGMPIASPDVRNQVSKAFYNQEANFLNPQFQQQRADLTSNLANQGITAGSEAANREWLNQNQTENRAYGNLANQAVVSGGDAMNQLFGMQMGARQQGVNELTTQGQFANAAQQQQAQEALQQQAAYNAGQGQLYSQYASNRTMPINMLNALLSSSQVNNPTYQAYNPQQFTPTPVLQGAQLQGQGVAANNSANAGLWGSALGAAGMAAGAKPPSDRRLKQDIKLLGKRGKYNWYSYTLGGQPQEGVMADEVEKILPDAISKDSLGFRHVDYSMLGL